jgi:dihydrodipicolinate reductase
MNIAIVGFGKMGHMIYKEAVERGENVVAVIDPWSPSPEVTALAVDAASLNNADVAIDFSHPATALENIHIYAQVGIPAVIGTTGWYDDIEEVKEMIKPLKPAIIYSGNFSIGVTAFSAIAKYAASIFNSLPDYDVSVKEIHHTQKKDAPSGTAIMLAEQMLPYLDRKDGTSFMDPASDKINITSERTGDNPGFHEIKFKSGVDEIVLSHQAFSRQGFAFGALMAARWISDGRRGLFTMDDFAKDFLKIGN